MRVVHHPPDRVPEPSGPASRPRLRRSPPLSSPLPHPERFASGARRTGLLLGLGAFLGLWLFGDLDPERPEVTRMAAIAVLMAVWWITEAIPLAATALLPLVLFPFLGIMDGREVAPIYTNHLIFLFLGGFIVALAMQRWNLHRRIALGMLRRVGAAPRRILFGFMAASAFLSMWISNSATTMMMVPIAMAIVARVADDLEPRRARDFSTGILLGVAYAASAGGMATLVGTPPNLTFSRIFQIVFPEAPEISFASWFSFALPVSLLVLTAIWTVLALRFLPRDGIARVDTSIFREEAERLGPLKPAEKRILCVFGLMILGWLFRRDLDLGAFTIPGWAGLFPHMSGANDGMVAVMAALLLFLLPSGDPEKGRIMDWESAEKLPYGMILLFGGGFALASGFKESGLSNWIGAELQGLGALHPLVLILLVCATLTFLTELTSNLATTEMVLPVLAAMAVSIEVDPRLLMIPATLSCSCAFMLPVATPPNAIAFGSRRILIRDMVRTGLWLNFIGIGIIALATWVLGGATLGIDADVMPDWAKGR